MLNTIKIRIYPNTEQINYINGLLGTTRFVYNKLLDYKITEYQNNGSNITFGQLGKKLVELKTEFPWMRESHSKVLQQSIINLNSAYNNFFKLNKGFPKFKSKKSNKQTCRFPSDAISGIKGNRINIINKLKDIHYKCSKRDEIRLNKYQKSIKSATLTKTKSNKYYLFILIDTDMFKKISKPINDIIGIDMGITDFVITSNNDRYYNLKLKRKNKNKLIRLHRQLSNKVNGSNNKNKCRIRLARLYEKINNKKEYYLHEISNILINDNQVISMEDLNVSGMVKNHKLASAIQEVSFYRFKEIIRYKSEWYNRVLVEIDRFYPSSKLCSGCGTKNTELILKDRLWDCNNCGVTHDRDYNASINIKNEGLRLLSLQ